MIEPVSKNNLEEILPLIRLYQEFYKMTNISEDKNRNFFSQFGESNPSGCQFLFRQNGKVVGFSTVYFFYASTIAEKVGVLNDLYTLPSNRGQGVGRQLIEQAYKYAYSHGAARLQWGTAMDNTKAQNLYDSMGARKYASYLYMYNAS